MRGNMDMLPSLLRITPWSQGAFANTSMFLSTMVAV